MKTAIIATAAEIVLTTQSGAPAQRLSNVASGKIIEVNSTLTFRYNF